MRTILTAAVVLAALTGPAVAESGDQWQGLGYGSGSYRDGGDTVHYSYDYRPTWGDVWGGVWSAYSGNHNDSNSRAGNGGNYGVGGSGRAR